MLFRSAGNGGTIQLVSAGTTAPITQSGTSAAEVKSTIDRLTDAGLVESKTGTTDRRRSELTLTEAGMAALKEIRDELFRLLTTALKDYSPEQIRTMGKMLQSLRDSAMVSPG